MHLETSKKYVRFYYKNYLGKSSSDQRWFYWKYNKEAYHFRCRKFIKRDLEEEEADNIDESDYTQMYKLEIPFKYVHYWLFIDLY
jgi:hypothetical protein